MLTDCGSLPAIRASIPVVSNPPATTTLPVERTDYQQYDDSGGQSLRWQLTERTLNDGAINPELLCEPPAGPLPITIKS